MPDPRRLATLLLLLSSPLMAPEAPSVRRRGLTLDHWTGAAGPAILRPTYRHTDLPIGRPGLDRAVAMFPDGMSLRPPLVTADVQIGLAQQIHLGPVSLLLKGGGAALVSAGLLGDRLLRVIPGVHAGLGLLLPVDARSMLRADLTRHVYTSDGRTVAMWSVGAGLAVPLQAKRAGDPASGPDPD
jgi:hypothetical protein